MKSILIIEDSLALIEDAKFRLAGLCKLTFASNISDARSQIHNNLDSFDLIAFDACLPGETPNTIPLVHEAIKLKFKGEMIAISSAPDYNQLLLNAGCTKAIYKPEVIDLILDLLKSRQ